MQIANQRPGESNREFFNRCFDFWKTYNSVSARIASYVDLSIYEISTAHFFPVVHARTQSSKPLRNFVLYTNGGRGNVTGWRGDHELAHLVQCEDHNIFDHDFGSRTWVHRDGKFHDDDLIREIEVFVIQWIMNEYKKEKALRETWDALAHLVHPSVWADGAGVENGFVGTGRRYDFFNSLTEAAWNKWNLEAIEAELKRKYQLIHAADPSWRDLWYPRTHDELLNWAIAL